MTTTIIHVNRHLIAKNVKDGGNRPVYTVKRGGTIRYANEVEVLGPSKMVYGDVLKCGARAWIETDSPVNLIGECSYEEAAA